MRGDDGVPWSWFSSAPPSSFRTVGHCSSSSMLRAGVSRPTLIRESGKVPRLPRASNPTMLLMAGNCKSPWTRRCDL